jgi:hypothetical protein
MEPAQPHEPRAEQRPQALEEPAGSSASRIQRGPGDRPPPASDANVEPAAEEPASLAPEHHGVGERVLNWIVPERNPEGAVYGIITIGALLAAESGLHDSYPDTVASLLIAVALYWFAHSYADVLGLRLSKQRVISWSELRQTFVQDWAIVRGASAPLLALLVAWALGASQETAVAAGTWTAVVGLIAFELAAGIRSRAKPVELTLEVLAGATMGLAILALRALLH